MVSSILRITLHDIRSFYGTYLTDINILELGHGIHDLVSKTSYTAFHGHRSPPDFAEVPSMMIEKWCWMVDELIQMSCHYTTLDATYLEQWQSEHHNEPPPPKKIPRSMLEGLIRSRKINMALSMLFQVYVYQYRSQDLGRAAFSVPKLTSSKCRFPFRYGSSQRTESRGLCQAESNGHL